MSSMIEMNFQDEDSLGTQLVDNFLPELWDCKEVLYIGAEPSRQHMVKPLREHGANLALIEAYRPYFDYFVKTEPDIFYRLTRMDIEDLTAHTNHDRYDAVVWWHGPEHLPKETATAVIEEIEEIAPIVLLCMPWGLYLQGPVRGNPYDIHRSTWTVEDLPNYKKIVIGEEDGAGRFDWIFAWRNQNENV